MFDTHAHIHDAVFDADRPEMLARARAAGVARIISVGTDIATSTAAREVAERYGLEFAIGIHPHEAQDAPADVAAALDELLAAGAARPRAIGEMGLDYFYDHSPRDVQRRVFVDQLRFARARALPAIFHQRDAFDDFVAVLAEAGDGIRGVVHCFTGTAAQALRLTGEFGLYLGIGGVATFKTAQDVRDAVEAVGLDRIILETDCPYLAPVPYRGKRNEPAFMAATAALLAGIFDTPASEIAARTTANAVALFGE
jgi:TatD DNase family protein